ncbi:MAG TPA: PE-PPE domain-containing protein [Mycobacterium sp.]|nr:PE-PPE domain-containing protein [Mycobacterium sp.]
MRSAPHLDLIAGIALVAAGVTVAIPAAPPSPGVEMRAVQLTAGEATDATGPTIGLVMGASGVPIPGPDYVDAADGLYVDNPLHPIYPGTAYPGVLADGVFTPEGLYPLTGVKVLPFNYPLDPDGLPAQSTSVGQGMAILGSNIQSTIAAGDTATVFGYSQSATISGLVMQQLDPAGTPSDLPVQFVLVGDPNAPNGGLLERFNGYETSSGQVHALPLNIPSLGTSFDGATPADDFQTSIYTLEYDGFADFPRYPLNLLADLNAFLGIEKIHVTYLNGGVDGSGPTAGQIANATLLPGSEDSTADPCADCLTNYYLIPQTAPLVTLLSSIPVIGKPLADLLGPDLTDLINLGYGADNLGYSDAPADVPTPFGLVPDVNPATVFTELVTGARQGLQAFESDLSDPSALVSSAALTSATDAAPVALPSLTDIVNAISSAASSAYTTLLPTADILNSLATTMPAYETALFLDNLQTGDLLDAFGLPVAADTALATIAVGDEFAVLENAAQAIAADFSGLF